MRIVTVYSRLVLMISWATSGVAAHAALPDRETVFDACMVYVETLSYPEGVGPEIMAPSCECVAREAAEEPIGASFVRAVAEVKVEDRDEALNETAQAVMQSCFGVSRE